MAAELNVHHDPEAAATVVASGAPARMYGLEVFEQVRLPRADIDALLREASPPLRLAGELCRAGLVEVDEEVDGTALAAHWLATLRERYHSVVVGGPSVRRVKFD